MLNNLVLLDRAEGNLLGEADLAVHVGAATHSARVNRARDAVALLHVQLGKGEALVVDSRVLSNIASRGLVEHVANHKAANGLVLGSQTTAVEAVDRGGATARARGLRAAMIAALCRHCYACVQTAKCKLRSNEPKKINMKM
jgi:hypothetical protein